MRFDVPSHHHSAPAPDVKPTPVSPSRRRRLKLPKVHLTTAKIMVTTCVIVILILGGLSGFLFWQNNKLKHQGGSVGSNSTADNQAIVKRTIADVGKLYALPKDETPTIATIRDVSQLTSQAFFKNAQNGDRVLVYSKNKFAILYRESTGKIINIGPVSVDQNSQTSASAPPQPQSPTVTNSAKKP